MSDLEALGAGPLGARKKLETFPVAKGVTWITLESSELIQACPVTGQPDHYRVTIRYRPEGRALETKSVKLYLWALADDEPTFAEDLADLIAQNVYAAGVGEVHVTLVQNPRGGITTTVEAVRGPRVSLPPPPPKEQP